jgi:hexosaminidase
MFPGTGFDSTRYGGYYTVAQIREIVDYAKERHITVIPELDIPAHCMAVIAAYPELSTTPDTIRSVATTWGIFNRQNNVLSPNEHTFRFLEDIFNELMDIFHDSPYIHFGADEAARIWWHQSEEAQEFMRKHNMTNEGEIQDYFVRFVVDVINRRGKTAIGWCEITNDPNLAGDIIVMNWRRVSYGVEAANNGHRVIMTPGRYTYLNYKQKPNEERTAHQRLLPLDSVYLFNLVPAGVLPETVKNIIGGQGCLWTEYFPYIAKVEYALFPRMSALAETFWSGEERKNLEWFKQKLSKQFDRYDLWGAQYSTYVIETGDVKRR